MYTIIVPQITVQSYSFFHFDQLHLLYALHSKHIHVQYTHRHTRTHTHPPTHTHNLPRLFDTHMPGAASMRSKGMFVIF